MIAALYVATDGCYFGLPNVDPWDEARDARKYAGPWPVGAHPPCARWGNFWWSARHLGKGLGDDEGCFGAALQAVRTYGGVLEHPSGSRAWPRFGLAEPGVAGWRRGLFDADGWTTEVHQRNYGHRANKCTWLYYVGDTPPPLDWSAPAAPAAWCSTDRPMAELRARGVELMGKRERKATPVPFRDLLIRMADKLPGAKSPNHRRNR